MVKYLNVSIRKEPHLMLQTLLKKVILYVYTRSDTL